MTAATPLVPHLLHTDFGLPCLFPPPAAAHEACFQSPSMQWVDNFLPELRLLLKVLGNPSNISLQRLVPQRSCLGKELKDRPSQSFYWRLSSKKQTNKYLFRIPNISSGEKHQNSVGNIFNSLFESKTQTVRSISNISGERKKKCGLKFMLG